MDEDNNVVLSHNDSLDDGGLSANPRGGQYIYVWCHCPPRRKDPSSESSPESEPEPEPEPKPDEDGDGGEDGGVVIETGWTDGQLG